jgi:hypothetical protein
MICGECVRGCLGAKGLWGYLRRSRCGSLLWSRLGIVERLCEYPASDGIISLFLHLDESVLEALDFVVFLYVVLGQFFALYVFLGAFRLELLDVLGHLANHGLGVGVCFLDFLRAQGYVVAPGGTAAVALGISGGHGVSVRWAAVGSIKARSCGDGARWKCGLGVQCVLRL